jgi:hypothetical protein
MRFTEPGNKLNQDCQMVYFQAKKSQFGQMLEGQRFENVNIFYDHLKYYTDIGAILWPLGKFCVHLVHFCGFGIMRQEKIWQP